jgi:uncharacterized protein YcaQ
MIAPELLNRFVLLRHGLLDREATDPVTLAGRICGLHAQVAPTPYLSLWARLRFFRVAELEQALYEDRTLVRLWAMRGTLHVLPADELPIYIGATAGAAMRRWVYRWKGVEAEALPLMARLKESVREILSQGPLTRDEISEAASHIALPDHTSWAQMIYSLCYQGDLVHARPTGKWYHYGRVRFAWRESWTGLSDSDIVPEEEARGQLLMRYLRAFGPATVHDFAYWAALKISEARQALERVRDQLTEVHLEDDKRVLWVRAEDLAVLQETDLAAPRPTRLLPRFDTLILGHRDKERFLAPENKKQVFRPPAEVAAMMLVDGHVAGTWKYRLPKGVLKDVVTNPFASLSSKAEGVLRIEVEALQEFCAEV